MPGMTTAEWEVAMMVASSAVIKLVSVSRQEGLSRDAAVLGVLIGALSVIRIDGLQEEVLWAEARRAVPQHLSKLAQA
jgi:hypothetical protein